MSRLIAKLVFPYALLEVSQNKTSVIAFSQIRSRTANAEALVSVGLPAALQGSASSSGEGSGPQPDRLSWVSGMRRGCPQPQSWHLNHMVGEPALLPLACLDLILGTSLTGRETEQTRMLSTNNPSCRIFILLCLE